mmetsp:Transcript_102012/g.207404  ORF Transcript_102012/g.207404 Transcript_102012/m.207404 type:complete len:233 (-) Transcript_102012:143-841(-)
MALTGSPMVVLLALLLTGAVVGAPSSECRGEQSCLSVDGPRSGGAMLQTASEKEGVSSSATRAKGAPLKGRLDTLEKEMGMLQDRTAQLELEVMGTEGAGEGPMLPAIDEAAVLPPAPEEAALASVDKRRAQPHRFHKRAQHDYVALAQGAADVEREGSLKERVAALEAAMAALKSKVSTLENQVAGKNLAGGLALLEKAAGSALKSRIVSLEEEADMMMARVSALEHTVRG